MRRTLYAAQSAISGPTLLIPDKGRVILVVAVVLTASKTVYFGHTPHELLEANRGVQGGTQLKDTSSPTDGRIPWRGDMWGVASTDNVEIDIEEMGQEMVVSR